MQNFHPPTIGKFIPIYIIAFLICLAGCKKTDDNNQKAEYNPQLTYYDIKQVADKYGFSIVQNNSNQKANNIYSVQQFDSALKSLSKQINNTQTITFGIGKQMNELEIQAAIDKIKKDRNTKTN